MFKKAKRANLRRRNDSDEDEQEESQSQSFAPTFCGPVVEIPFIETSGAPSCEENSFSNGFLANLNHVRPVKKEKKVKEVAVVAPPTKAILLSFDDDEGNRAKVANQLTAEETLQTHFLYIMYYHIRKTRSCRLVYFIFLIFLQNVIPFCLVMFTEGSEVFRVKKPNHSKKIVKQLKKEYKEDLQKSGNVKQETKSGEISCY